MDSDGILGYIILLFILILLNAFFAMSELAIVSLNDNKVRRLASEGDKKAEKLLRFIESPTNFLSTIQIGVTLSGFLASAVAADTFAEKLVLRFGGRLPMADSTLRMLSLMVITLLLSYLTLIFGELVPKRIAMQHYEKISFAIVGILSAMATFLSPFVTVVSASTNAVLRLIGIDPHQQPEEITEEEIRMMLDVGKESGHIHETDRDMIDSIFEFDDRYVEDIMTHRTEIMALGLDASLGEALEVAVDSGYSRIPVYDGDLDNIVGVLYVKDLVEFATSQHGDFRMEDYLRPALFTIETTTCEALLAQFRETKIQMAIVVDEYGGTAGLVSMEDLLETIIGNIQDEYDDEEEEISEISEDSFIVDGLTPMEEVFDFFDMGEPDEDDDFDTIGGYILNRLGQIPAPGEHPTLTVGNVLFTVKKMDERRIAKLRADCLPEPEDTPELDPQEVPDGIRERVKRTGKKNGKNGESPEKSDLPAE